MIASFDPMDFLAQHSAPLIAAAIVLIGLLAFGFNDLIRFSLVRAWAISTVCFRQSIRRRVLWITPLVILGVIVVSQFQKPIDEQDAIRQTTLYCLFATGLLVSIVTIILACTNLPQEIENRVIYTVATKPTTRLEIIVGKIIGFVRVSFWILLIMGIFSLGYLHFRDHQLRASILGKLKSLPANDGSRPTLEYYRDRGTLHARQLGLPDVLNFYAHEPRSNTDRWINGDGSEQILAYFRISRPPVNPATFASTGLVMAAGITPQPAPRPPVVATAPSTSPAQPPKPPAKPVPRVTVDLLNIYREAIVTSQVMGADAMPVPADGVLQFEVTSDKLDRALPPGSQNVDVLLAITGSSDQFLYGANPKSFVMVIPETGQRFTPYYLEYGGHVGSYGYQQLRGGPADESVAVYDFRDQTLTRGLAVYPFELRVGIESSHDEDILDDSLIKVSIDFKNLKTNQVFRNITVYPDNNRPLYFDVPAAAIEGGDFQAILRMRTSGWLGLKIGNNASLKLVGVDQTFAFNLAKSLAVLWLMSLLITIISVFCSTFLSWPIAVMLTLVILFGRWGAQQLDIDPNGGLGRMIVTDMFRESNAATANAVSQTVDQLVKALTTISAILPDISQFSALEYLERGVALPASVLLSSLHVVLLFGLPLVVVAYIFLKYKEVAP